MADEDQSDQDDQNPDIKDLRRAADDGKAARAEAEQARRELAFVKAGVDTDSKLGKLLLKTYEGDLTTDAIKAEAAELGLGQPAGGNDQASEQDRAQTRERTDLASEPDVSQSEGPDPNKVARTSFEEARNNGESREMAAGAYLSEMLRAAHSGDKRVLL